MSLECEFNQEFDPKHMFQYVNNEIAVMHCHHYATLFTKLAIDMDKQLGSILLLRESMEESAYLTLQRLVLTQQPASQSEKVEIAQQYFGLSGLGQLEMTVKSNGGSAKLIHSHVDEGWVKKWRKEKKPVNFIGQGYIIAAFAIINGRPIGTYEIDETKSIVTGDGNSEFTITEKR